MSTEIETVVDIAASPQRVWAVLTNFPTYGSWNPFLLQVRGKLKKRARLDIRAKVPGHPEVRFRPRILVVAPERELRWIGHVLVAGVFDGEHWFRLEPIPGGTRLHHGERFDGFLATIFGRPFVTATRRGFEAMNEALKIRAETRDPDAAG